MYSQYESRRSSLLIGFRFRLVGWLPDSLAEDAVETLRALKTKADAAKPRKDAQVLLDRVNTIPADTEVAFIPRSKYAGQFPGLFLFLESAGRFARPVKNLRTGRVEWIGSLEQVYLNIAVNEKEAVEGISTHCELTEQAFLSEVASMTPYSDHNQSPRNLYQCQASFDALSWQSHCMIRSVTGSFSFLSRWGSNRWRRHFSTTTTVVITSCTAYRTHRVRWFVQKLMNTTAWMTTHGCECRCCRDFLHCEHFLVKNVVYSRLVLQGRASRKEVWNSC